MTTEKDFSSIAHTWDEKPQRLELAAAVACAIKEQIPLTRSMEALDFGSGTGLVTFHLHHLLKHVTTMDSAQGMLDVVAQKACAAAVENVTTMHSEAAVPNLKADTYDIIYSSMVLHHVHDLNSTLKSLAHAVKSGGVIALADLVVEDGSFHDNSQGVAHHGVDPKWLIEQLELFGFEKGHIVVAHQIVKQRGSNSQQYPVFLMWAYKK